MCLCVCVCVCVCVIFQHKQQKVIISVCCGVIFSVGIDRMRNCDPAGNKTQQQQQRYYFPWYILHVLHHIDMFLKHIQNICVWNERTNGWTGWNEDTYPHLHFRCCCCLCFFFLFFTDGAAPLVTTVPTPHLPATLSLSFLLIACGCVLFVDVRSDWNLTAMQYLAEHAKGLRCLLVAVAKIKKTLLRTYLFDYSVSGFNFFLRVTVVFGHWQLGGECCMIYQDK